MSKPQNEVEKLKKQLAEADRESDARRQVIIVRSVRVSRRLRCITLRLATKEGIAMNKFEIKNAVITGTMLGYEDHGILSAMIYLDYGGSGQGFGGYVLDSASPMPHTASSRREDSLACGLLIRRVLQVVGVSKWEDLKGKSVRVEASWSEIAKLGNYLKDEWFDIRAEMKALRLTP
jgi:hypothetical protein